jgi:hypothetical protein
VRYFPVARIFNEFQRQELTSPVDVIFPAFPIWYVMSPDYLRFLLEPVVQYLATGRWTKVSNVPFFDFIIR